MKGSPVGVERTRSRSPEVKARVMITRRPRRAFGATLHMIARGRTRLESEISSAGGYVRRFANLAMGIGGCGLTHVDRAIVADEHIERGHHAYQRCEAHRIPPSLVDIRKQSRLSRSPRAHDPERDNNCENTADMKAKEDALNQWQLYRQEGVEDDSSRNNGDRDQRRVPSLWDIGFVVECYQCLDDTADHEADSSEVNLPANR